MFDIRNNFKGLAIELAADAEARAVLFYSYLFGQSLLDGKPVTPAARERAVRAMQTPPGLRR